MTAPITPPKTYSGLKMTLAIIAAISVVALAVNVLGYRLLPQPSERPPPVVTTISPSP